MKKHIHILLAIGISLMVQTVNAATFTAITNGDWSSGATWSGGNAPSYNIILDEVIIPAGIEVNLDGNVMFDGIVAELNVDGKLSSSSQSIITLQQGLITGSGEVSVGRITFGTAANSTFNGEIVANILVTNGYSLFVNGHTSVHDSVILRGSDITINISDTLWVAQDAIVWCDNGTIEGSGTFMAEGEYSVHYAGGSNDAGLELETDSCEHVTVDLDDNNAVVSSNSDVHITGALTMSSGQFDMTGQRLQLSGDLNQSAGSNLHCDDSSELWFTSNTSLSTAIMLDANNNECSRVIIDIADGGQASFGSDARVISELRIISGNMSVESGSSFSMASDAMIWINEGSIDMDGASSFNNEGNINIKYTGSSKSAGAELHSGTVSKFELELADDNQSLTLTGNLMISDSAKIQQGWITCNGNDVSFHGYTHGATTIKINGDEMAGIYLNGMMESGSQVEFHGSEDTVRTLAINLSNQAEVWVMSNLSIVDTLNCNNGVMVISDANLWLRGTAETTGGNASSYIMTEGSAQLNAVVQGGGASNTLFAVGDDDGYCPLRLTNEAASNTEIAVNLVSGVYSEGNSGFDYANSSAVVNKTWNVTSSTSTEFDLTMTAEWTSAMEVNGFDRTEAYISHYINGEWDAVASSAAQASGSGSFTLTRTGITSLSPFSVQNEGAVSGLDELETAAITIYPNPVTDVAYVEYAAGDLAEMYDLNGKLVRTVALATNAQRSVVDLSSLEPGIYFFRVFGEGRSLGTHRIVKQ